METRGKSHCRIPDLGFSAFNTCVVRINALAPNAQGYFRHLTALLYSSRGGGCGDAGLGVGVMLRQRRAATALAVALGFLPLAGCAIVDKYSDRAVEYNLQAEKTQQQNLLLNIIRASDGRIPL